MMIRTGYQSLLEIVVVVLLSVHNNNNISYGFVRDASIRRRISLLHPRCNQCILSRQQQIHLSSTIDDTRSTSSSSSVKIDNSKSKSSSSVWYPSRIQDTVDYNSIVQRLYIRHIVTETESMAKQAMQLSTTFTINTNSTDDIRSSSNDSMDPFGTIAKALSACAVTRNDGGIIGWVECPTTIPQPSTSSPSSITSHIISDQVIYDLYQLRPKAGDIYILHDDTDEQNLEKYHVIQVMELWMNYTTVLFNTNMNTITENEEITTTTGTGTKAGENVVIGSFYGTNRIIPRRKKLKGYGVYPQFPTQPTTYHIHTSGCQMNVADSERLEGILQHELQLRPITDSSSVDNVATTATSSTVADIVLFNTCSIRDHAEQKLYDAIGPYAIAKRKGKQVAIIVTGCVAQQEGEALIKRIPEIDAVIGPQYVPYLHNIIETISYGQQVVVTAPMLLQDQQSNDDNNFLTKPIRGHRIRAWVNVIHGCNEHCTYCVVPGTRGMEQSRTMESILQECIQLSNNGYKEITLLGQNIDAYGRDMIPKRTFADLLLYLNTHIPNHNMRIRYVTSHPRYFSDRVIDAVASLDKICECFHMPFQAGDDTVLRNMRRGYTYDSYMSIIRKIRNAAPDASICTDIIVGFPGETEEQFQKTLQLMNEVQFDNVNSFAYSPRPNTEAATYTNQISDEIKSDRLQRVQQLAIQHGYERSLRYLHTIVEVLVEDRNPRNIYQVMGRTRQGRQVYFDGDIDILLGQLVHVKIIEARTWSLMGELVQ